MEKSLRGRSHYTSYVVIAAQCMHVWWYMTYCNAFQAQDLQGIFAYTGIRLIFLPCPWTQCNALHYVWSTMAQWHYDLWHPSHKKTKQLVHFMINIGAGAGPLSFQPWNNLGGISVQAS